jgi:predicted enzyme related to lactoylglutathione lyase
MRTPLIKKVDCVQFYVSDLEQGIKLYRDVLGHKLIWRTNDSAGLQMPESDAEIVIQTNRKEQETDLLVDSVDSSVKYLVDAGFSVVVPAFDIQVGRCVVIDDPWGNRMVLLDLSKGKLATDSTGRVVGNVEP